MSILLRHAAASTTAPPVNYIEDVFSNYLYTGTGAAQTITNGIDLAGKGGMVWIKDRDSGAKGHALFDTARGVNLKLQTQSTNGQFSGANQLTAFNADGFSLGSASDPNGSGTTYVGWTFRKQPKFFDIVTYTGDGTSSRVISHNLGSAPGCIIIKRTDSTSDCFVFHRSATENLLLNGTTGVGGLFYIASSASTTFTLGTNTTSNASSGTYVAYLFAHDAGGFGLTGTDNVISCGSVSATGGTLAEVNLGWEPQWLLIKGSSIINGWSIIDNMRGFTANKGISWLQPNTAAAEVASPTTPSLYLTSTGFKVESNESPLNGTGTYIYIAIRRGPMAVPTLGTSVFTPSTFAGTGVANQQGSLAGDMYTFGFKDAVDGINRSTIDRLRGGGTYLLTHSTNAETTAAGQAQFYKAQNGVQFTTYFNGVGNNMYMHEFKRAPGFFDVVCYTGAGGNSHVINHNLAAPAEMIFIKGRSQTVGWIVGTNLQATNILVALNSASAEFNPASNKYYFGDGVTTIAPTSTQFTVRTGDINYVGATYVAYLFATLAGVSKCGTYTGNGTTQTINCGFTTGARFVLIKRTDDTGDWFVWDTSRGIVAGNDPYLLLNSASAEVTTNDSIDPDASGFIVNQIAATDINVTSASYIFLAIA